MRRSRTKIIWDVLEEIYKRPATPYTIMKNANLSYRLVLEYLKMLSSNKLLQKKDGWFYLSTKGKTALEKFRDSPLKEYF